MYPKITQFLADHPDVETVEVVLTDLNGVFRGKWLPRDGVEKLLAGGFKMPLSSVCPDIWGRDVAALCEFTGDADGLCTAIDDSIRRLAQEMTELMYSNGGVGLAAPQVGESIRLIVVDPTGGEHKE